MLSISCRLPAVPRSFQRTTRTSFPSSLSFHGVNGDKPPCAETCPCPLGCQGHAALPTNLSFPLFFSQALGASEAPRALRPAPAF